eukprot:1601003-Amphidinium_carterae.1
MKLSDSDDFYAADAHRPCHRDICVQLCSVHLALKLEVQSKMGLIFMSMMNFALGGMSTLPEGFDQRAVFYKQRDAGFYRTFAYSLSQNIVNLPVTILKVVVFVTIIYWASGATQTTNYPSLPK